jgi:hypothetical protein
MDKTESLFICEDSRENKKHADALDNLSKDLGISIGALMAVYRSEFDRLDRQAKIRDYLSIFIVRKVRDSVKTGSA